MRRVGKGFGTLFALAVLAGGLLSPAASAMSTMSAAPAASATSSPELADVTSSASIHLQFPDIDTLRVGIITFVRPSPFEAVVDPTLAQLARTFGEDRIEVTHYTLPELAQAVRKGEVDVFLASSGFFVRLVADGARSLATVVSRDYPDPNHNFSTVTYMGGGRRIHEAFDLLREGEADVVNVRLCFFEEWLETHPEDEGRFRVLNRKDGPGEACRRSTDLYPSWTIASTAVTAPDVSRLVTRALLEMPPVGEKQLYWGVATDFSSIDQLYRDLKTGPYAYLREWTVRRFVSEHREWFILAALLALGLVGHSVRVSQLVRRRTRALVTALDTQKQLEDKARAAGERLQRLERIGVVGQLSTIFAHEMRQPLGAISLYSFALRKMAQAAGKTDGTQSPGTVPAASILDVLEKLDRQTARADAIVTKVRSYAKRQGASRSVVALKDLVGSAVTDLRITGRWKSVIETMPMEEVDIDADPLEMELVAVNLTKNALESLDAQVRDGTFPASTSYVSPTVIVSVTRETVEGEPHAVLTVTDNGRAVGDDLLTSLADMAPSSKSEGLGLGLSIVRGIVENHAGRLTFGRSAWGSLSVRVTLPVAKPKTAAPEPSESEASSETPGTPAAPGGL